jgi:glucosylglycerate synthase
VEHESTLSDALLKQLMAVGQVDVLVGLPTLNNAATVVDVARAIHACFTRDFPRLRTVLINSDGGSTDGTPDLVRQASFADVDVVQTSHSLRTLHRVVAPYHGLPGKKAALHALFVAAELTQAKTLAVVDPAGPATTSARVTELIGPVARSEAEFLAPRYRRHPRDGMLVTQLVRPLVRAAYRVGLDEPLGAEFACSGTFASHCLEQSIWDQDAARFAIDLWLRTEAMANQLTIGQIWRPASTIATAVTLRQAVRQILLSLVVSLRAHESYWQAAAADVTLQTWGIDSTSPEAPVWDYDTLAVEAQQDIAQIAPLLHSVLEEGALSRLTDQMNGAPAPLDDELWVRIVYAFLGAASQRNAAVDELADMFVPLYMWRAAAFMRHTASEPSADIQMRLDGLCDAFQRLRPVLVSGWAAL